MIWCTHNIFVGEPADLVWLDGLEWAGTTADAARIILSGNSVLLPYDDWRTRVSDLLGLLGASPDHIQWVLRTARRCNEGLLDRWPDRLPSHL
jgi:hypothetical protein